MNHFLFISLANRKWHGAGALVEVTDGFGNLSGAADLTTPKRTHA